MKRAAAVQTAARQLFTAELAIDGAFGETTTLASLLVRLRSELSLSPTVGQPAVDAVAAAIAALSNAQGALGRAHSELEGVKARIGCRTVATGGMEKQDEISGSATSCTSPALEVIAA